MSFLGYNYKKASFYTKWGFLVSTTILGCHNARAIERMQIDPHPSSNQTQALQPFSSLILCIQNDELDVWKGMCGYIESSNPYVQSSIKYSLHQLFAIEPELMKNKISGFAQSNVFEEQKIAYDVWTFLANSQDSWNKEWLTAVEDLNRSGQTILLSTLILLYNQKGKKMEGVTDPLIRLFQLGDNIETQIYKTFQKFSAKNNLREMIIKLSIDQNPLAREIAQKILAPLLFREIPWAMSVFKELEQALNPYAKKTYKKTVKILQDEAFDLHIDENNFDEESDEDEEIL